MTKKLCTSSNLIIPLDILLYILLNGCKHILFDVLLKYFNRWFERFLLFIILINSICLASYDYEDRDNLHRRNKALNVLGYIFNAIFILECIIKIIAKGFIIHKTSYLKNGWNILDFIVVITCIIDFMPFQST